MELQTITGNDTLILVALLAVFLIVGYKVLDVLKNAIIIAVLSAVFPHFLNSFFGTGLATSLNAELTYVVAGVGMYFIYELLVILLRTGSIFWEIAKLIATPIVWIYDGLKNLLRSIAGERKEGAQKPEPEAKAASAVGSDEDESGDVETAQLKKKRKKKAR